MLVERAGARYNASISECIYVTEAALFCFVWIAQNHVGWENNSPRFRGRQEKWQDYRDQRSNQSPAVRGESWEGGGGELDGESYRKVRLYTAYGTLRCEGGKGRLSIFQSHSCRDPSLHPRYLGCAWGARVRVCVCVMVSSSLPGDMALCFTARSAVTTTSTTRAVTCRR